MSVLRNLEAKIEGVVQGAFSRAFKSNVQPVELARKLAKEMEENKSVSISRVYVPNEYNVFLSPDDRTQFEGYETALTKELSDYLLEHARAEGLALVTRPVVTFKTDERLGVGEFGIQSVLSQPPEDEQEEGEAGPSQADFGHTMVYSPDRAPRRLVEEARSARAMLVGEGRRRVLSGDTVVVGRSREADVVLEDPNVSRKHAELRREDGRWAIADLGSTNGVKVNGRLVERAWLESGDEILLGTSRLQFEEE
jgi:pSer/pThr/pTyr-binding forkhead associated (FHA) protein